MAAGLPAQVIGILIPFRARYSSVVSKEGTIKEGQQNAHSSLTCYGSKRLAHPSAKVAVV